MNKISQYNYITVKELIFIHAYVTGEEISDRQALQILKQIPGTIKQSRRYCIRKNGEELFEYYRKKQPKLFDKQKLYTYEELKHRAEYYCSSYLMIHL
ncbi:50S ribosomal protein L7ae [Bacillus sp. CH126_4D]|uniref:50S ribosomal protein L7ae n=1 Tax=unclassified Bacillus (in: firmicutes) TaxID=185979 RepID=UPI00124C998E|nr:MULTISPECIES: 50S ribosomal protein L7ae [unclassified Bacillus (in: firmicutes)]KAB2460957.1 50S ribosomal protein L7ae [Bacillus sp. CH140a_4T]KAB2475039.1 50S ribosomal protein L7ae [Bacillus sp. CH126_4D]